MQQETIYRPEIKLVGLCVRTNNNNERNHKTAKIGQLASEYWSQNIATIIPWRSYPGVTLSAYTNYDSNEHGDYTYFIGEEVSYYSQLPKELQTLTIKPAHYIKFTTGHGKMPEIIINAWEQIWKMTPQELGGKRAFQTDLEIYDERAHDPTHTCVDILISIDSV